MPKFDKFESFIYATTVHIFQAHVHLNLNWIRNCVILDMIKTIQELLKNMKIVFNVFKAH